MSHVSDRLDGFAELIRSRRTNLRVDPTLEVPTELVRRLCELASWAPNHRQTWPWRFALFTGDGRARLGSAIADEMARLGGYDEGKIAKNRTKYLRAPAVVAVASAAGPSATVTAENRDATAAAVQNLLLAAHAGGLAGFWSSCDPAVAGPVQSLAGFDPDTAVVGIIYLGWPIGDVPVPARPPVVVTAVTD
jgi:nitroreductase